MVYNFLAMLMLLLQYSKLSNLHYNSTLIVCFGTGCILQQSLPLVISKLQLVYMKTLQMPNTPTT